MTGSISIAAITNVFNIGVFLNWGMQYTMQALKTKPKDMWAAHWEGKDQHALVTASSSPGNEIVSTENIRLSADRLSAIPLISDSDYRPTDYQRLRLSADIQLFSDPPVPR